MSLRDRIIAKRKSLGWSMNELARKAGLNPPTLQKIEAGKSEDPSVSLIVAIAKALDESVEDLWLGPATDQAQLSSDFATAADFEALRDEWRAFRLDLAETFGLQAEALEQPDSSEAPVSPPVSAAPSRRGSGGRKGR